MGYIKVTNIETGEVELEVGVKPIYEHDDEKICPHSQIGISRKPKQQYVERMKETKDNDIHFRKD